MGDGKKEKENGKTRKIIETENMKEENACL